MHVVFTHKPETQNALLGTFDFITVISTFVYALRNIKLNRKVRDV